jgi:hydroxymethylbilane synthase
VGKLRVGTRGSDLALVQTRWVLKELGLAFDHNDDATKAELVVISTKGDEVQDKSLSQVGGSGLFLKEIETALLEQRIDFAVHSMKDIPSKVPEGLALAATTRREDPRDAIVVRRDLDQGLESVRDLPAEATIATGSLRRRSQIASLRPDIRIEELRGNVPTRLRKLDESSWHAIVLAAAGLRRLGREDRIAALAPTETLVPAVGQGALAIETRSDDEHVRSLVRALNDREAELAVSAERALLSRLEGGCQVPIGAYAQVSRSSDQLRLRAYVGSVDGSRHIRSERSGPTSAAEEIGLALAESMLEDGAQDIIDAAVDSSRVDHGGSG